ncbi:hypothetical protein PSTG_07295 [Puccinia striiformis f. sp. tritici PST-78]|uniref:Uncharacterized protein n=1 Tax=Puccinia striiformis f. sp. tritici PST-78 TaxID=1165861 RepID=A0A0L0VJB8_9BASI|nr:hypothetical protein PSTG_07295 [Puccinia striiformis f. sp. tritici PST-78]
MTPPHKSSGHDNIIVPRPYMPPSYARSPHNVLRERHRNSDRMAGPLPRTIAVGIEYNVYLQDDDQLENQDPHLFTNPKGCSINLNTAVDFQGFKKAVIDQIGQADKRLQDMLTTDVASDNPQSSWGLQIQNNEAALFRGSIHMPIADDSMYKQWNWGIRVTQNGRPIVNEDAGRPIPIPATHRPTTCLLDQPKLRKFVKVDVNGFQGAIDDRPLLLHTTTTKGDRFRLFQVSRPPFDSQYFTHHPSIQPRPIRAQPTS